MDDRAASDYYSVGLRASLLRWSKVDAMRLPRTICRVGYLWFDPASSRRDVGDFVFEP